MTTITVEPDSNAWAKNTPQGCLLNNPALAYAIYQAQADVIRKGRSVEKEEVTIRINLNYYRIALSKLDSVNGFEEIVIDD